MMHTILRDNFVLSEANQRRNLLDYLRQILTPNVFQALCHSKIFDKTILIG